MFIIVNSGMTDDGETFVEIVGKPHYALQDAKDEFYEFITESYFSDDETIPRDFRSDNEDGTFVDLQDCIYTNTTDGYTHIELKCIKT